MPVQMFRYSQGDLWKPFLGGKGPGPIPGPVFTVGTTMPTTFNTARPAGSPALTDYPDKNTARTINVDTPTTFTDIDFGNVKVNVRCAGLVYFLRCKWRITNDASAAPPITCWDNRVTNVLVEFCDIENVAQNVKDHPGIQGHHFTVRRSWIRGFVDGVRPSPSAPAGTGGSVLVEANVIGPLAWLAADTTGIVHPSDTVSHNDAIQAQVPATIRGNLILAYPSSVVGTGTPGSGTDTGNAGGWYTQAQAEAKRASILNTSTPAAKSYGGVSYEAPVTVSGIMCNFSSYSTALSLLVEDNWIAGGNVGINARDTSLTSPLGTFQRNRFYNDKYFSGTGGKTLGIAFRSDLTATVPTSGSDRNVWLDDNSTVARNT